MDRPPSLASRILHAAPTRLVLSLAAIFAVEAAVSVVFDRVRGHLAGPLRSPVFTALAVPAVVAAYVAVVRALERRPIRELAGAGAVTELGRGCLLGAAVFCATIGIIASLGGYVVTGTQSASVLVGAAAMAIQSGFTEEIIARGVVFRIVEEWLGTWAALAISAALFGLVHLGNAHATLWGAIAIAMEAGPLLAAAYLRTRRLWFPIGLHAAWNFTQGGIFGVAVSGGAVAGVLRGEARGPAWLSGGEFGAEASVVATVVCTAVAAVLLRGVVRKGGIEPRSLRTVPASGR